MRSWLEIVLLIAPLWALPRPAIGQVAPPQAAAGPSDTQHEAAIRETRRLIGALRRAAGIPGLSVAVGVGDRLVWAEGFGVADLEAGAAATPATRYRAASVSKVLTIAGAARLWADQRLEMDAPVSRYVPAFSGPEAVTPRLLAGHLAGIRNYIEGDDALGLTHFDSISAVLPAFVDDALTADPGTSFGYSTFGYILLSAVMESAAGQPFLDVMQETVFEPLEMLDTGPDLVAAVLPGRSGYYSYVPGQGGVVENAPLHDPSYKWAGGGLLTTAPDLVRFSLAHLRPGFLPEPVLAELFTSQRTADGKETGVGFGWRVGSDAAGRRIVHHAGGMHGARSLVMLWPDDDFAIALLSNLTGVPVLVEQTAQILAGPWLAGEEATAGAQTASEPADATAGEATTDPPALPSGTFRYEGTASGESASGLLRLGSPAGAPDWFEIPANWFKHLQGFGLPNHGRFEIVTSRADGQGFEVVLATPFGLAPMKLAPRPDGLVAGELQVGPMQLTFEARPLGF
jgi:CubicO group peptidase (beta-lactamase class C family)